MQEHLDREAYLPNLFIIIIHIFFSKLIKHTLKQESVLRKLEVLFLGRTENGKIYSQKPPQKMMLATEIQVI